MSQLSFSSASVRNAASSASADHDEDDDDKDYDDDDNDYFDSSSTSSSDSDDASSFRNNHVDNDDDDQNQLIIPNTTQKQQVQRGSLGRRSIASAFESMINGYMGENLSSSHHDHHCYSQQLSVVTDAVTVTNEIQIIASAKSVEPAREEKTTTTTTTSNKNTPTRIKKKIVPTDAATATAAVTMMMSSTKTTPARMDYTQHDNPSSTQSNSRYEHDATEIEKPNENVQHSSMVEGAKVYIRDPHYSWLPATIISPFQDDKQRIQVKIQLPSDWEDYTAVLPSLTSATMIASGGASTTSSQMVGGGSGSGFNILLKRERLVNLSEYRNNELPLQNENINKADMADLTHLHEAAILYNLKARHASSLPYTRVGDILVAVNPFWWIEGLYSKERQDFYATNLIWQQDQHYYYEGGQGRNSASGDDGKKISNNTTIQPLLLATAASERKAIGYEYEKLGIHPHVYESSSLAYLGLSTDRIDQTILVTGESGAGKTETIKIVMNHLATVERSRPGWPESDRVASNEFGGSDTVTKVLQSNPLFEAFGNAKTLRNDNSSRFGKFTQLQFDVENSAAAQQNGRGIPSCHLAGSTCITYLLEKSRVVCAAEGERTFHIFYQLLGAPEEEKRVIWEEGLIGASSSDFAYLNQTSPEDIDGLATPENWPITVAALSTFGIQGDAFINVARSLCVVLQLGNIVFDAQIQNGNERSVISSTEELEKLSSLLGVPAAEIEPALTTRLMITRGEEFTIFLKPNEAKDGCDALAKEIYARVFDILVRKCNETTEPKVKAMVTGTHGRISLLDIFGFESFKINRFEQLCINYANERLQQKYVLDNFHAIKHEYEEEGVNVFDFSLVDNTDVMELLEGKLGLITQLNEECVKKGAGGDENFVYKFKVVNSDSARMIQDHLHRPYEFGIRHYAAPITYDARGFIERNLDKIPPDLLKCACKSTNKLIREEFLELSSLLEAPSATGGVKMRSDTTKHLVFSKFKHQLSSLMSLIEKSRTRYIRCVKPNKEMAPRIMDHSHTVAQLESAGLVTAIVISRESFPNRLPYELVMKRFRFLEYKFPNCHLTSGDIKLDVETLLHHLLAERTIDSHQGKVKLFACGKTRVYFRAGALESIETIRQDYYAERAIQLQAWIRSLLLRQQFLALKHGMIRLQSSARCWLARTFFIRKVCSVVTMQSFARHCLAREELARRRKENASIIIQARWRSSKPRQKYKAIRNATIRIQCVRRMITEKRAYASKRKEIAEQRVMETRMSMIQQTLDDASTIHQGTVFSVDEGLLDEVETMFNILREEIIVLRKRNTILKKELAEKESERRELSNHSSSIDHALAVAKIRNEQMNKTNMTLLDDNNRRRKEVQRLKNELTMQQQAHEAQLREMRAEFDIAMRHHDREMSTMAQHLEMSTAASKREVQQVRDESKRKQEEQFTQMTRLREEIKGTQDSHQVYMSKLMDVLESTQESRKISLVSDDFLLRQKDDEIAELRNEVSKLLKQQQVLGGADNKHESKSMKHIIKKNREHRKSQVQYLCAMARQVMDALANNGEESSQIQELIVHMHDTIRTSEKSNSRMDREMVNMIDRSSTWMHPQQHHDENAALLIAENQKLWRKLEKKYTCKKCGHSKSNKSRRGGGISEEDTLSVIGEVRKGDVEI